MRKILFEEINQWLQNGTKTPFVDFILKDTNEFTLKWIFIITDIRSRKFKSFVELCARVNNYKDLKVLDFLITSYEVF